MIPVIAQHTDSQSVIVRKEKKEKNSDVKIHYPIQSVHRTTLLLKFCHIHVRCFGDFGYHCDVNAASKGFASWLHDSKTLFITDLCLKESISTLLLFAFMLFLTYASEEH